MSNIVDPLVAQIATRVRAEREQRRWTLAQVADASGVSRAMINRIERAESCPTAIVLSKLAVAFQVRISDLLTPAEDSADAAPKSGEQVTGVRRRADATEWRDPATGYRRRQITGPRFPADIAEIRLPPGARVPYPAAYLAYMREVIWVLDGRLTFHEGDAVHDLGPGDSIELVEPVPHVFANTGDTECRYAIIMTRVDSP
ncbi:XRE family transcriptional regulator [Amycolatopsis rhabdoformis]|uniref:XRE family transcriptional regulator n=1 Tax=Amycolatopsis rhabdoformis TaxID=1448059 RepID=A0ABZ1IHA9_9PSEU|nr:XRE family transcriptional regulator [Amycolatopsis rhabdoformis]WSE33523.1 XRE family transcriptional regulator [Amycolatopsis rhabdoformis]